MPRQVREKADNYADLEEDQGGLLSMLITFFALIAITALICTIIWKVTHKEPRAELGKVQGFFSARKGGFTKALFPLSAP